MSRCNHAARSRATTAGIALLALTCVADAQQSVVTREVSAQVQPASTGSVISHEVSVFVPYADLVTTIPEAPTSVRAGTYVAIEWSVTNQGGSPARSSFVDVVGLTVDSIIGNGDDIVLATPAAPVPVGPGQTYFGESRSWLPVTASGNYQIFVQTDPAGAVDESGAVANNVAFAPLWVSAFDGAVLTFTTVIPAYDHRYDGKHIIVESGTATIDGFHEFASLTLRAGSEVAHASGSEGGLVLDIAGDVVVDAGAKIDTSGRGFGPAQGPGAGQGFRTGGSHGGRGAMGGRPGYGRLTRPDTLGSGGGGSSGVNAGGGRVEIQAAGVLWLDGEIRADGTPSASPGTTSRAEPARPSTPTKAAEEAAAKSTSKPPR